MIGNTQFHPSSVEYIHDSLNEDGEQLARKITRCARSSPSC